MLLISIMLICIRDRSYDEWHLILFCVKLRGCSWRGDLPFDPMIVRPFFFVSGPHLSRWVLDSWYFGGATSQGPGPRPRPRPRATRTAATPGSICIWIGIWSWFWVCVRIPDTVRNVSVSALSWFGTRVPLHALVASVNKSWQLSVWPLKSGEGEIGSHLDGFFFFLTWVFLLADGSIEGPHTAVAPKSGANLLPKIQGLLLGWSLFFLCRLICRWQITGPPRSWSIWPPAWHMCDQEIWKGYLPGGLGSKKDRLWCLWVIEI